ncbi:MAG: glycosyltransferase family 39 protein [Anaerolineae bacterium]|nr:glycosyltransferase family 39 protein [Anaerolineae bacterium]
MQPQIISSNRRNFSPILAITAILILAASLRGAMLLRDVRLQADESLYTTYARAWALHGDWLLISSPVPLDKPPLGLALTTSGFVLFGVSEFGGRVITVLLSLCAVAATYGLTRRLYDQRTAVIAALLLALCPFDLAFAATLFHDPALTLWLLLVPLALISGRGGLAGIFAAAALATKQSALQFLPVFLLIAIVAERRLRWRSFALALVIGIVLLALYSIARAAPVDFWSLGISNPGQLRVIRSDEVIPRLQRWTELLGKITGVAPLLLIALVPLIRNRVTNSRSAALDYALACGLLITLLLYWLLAYNTYDRYLLPLVPLLLILIARGLLTPGRGWRLVLTLITVIAMLLTLGANLRGDYGIGGEADVVGGVDQFAAQIAALPADSVVHQFWLDWHLGYYMGDPTAHPLPMILFQSSPESLYRYLMAVTSPHSAASSQHRQYLALPATFAPRWQTELAKSGIQLHQLISGRFVLFEVILPKSD